MAYITRSDIEDVFGPSNVAAWSSLENDQYADADRITTAITWAEAELNRRLRLMGYSTPVPSSSVDYATVQQIAIRFAAEHLYGPRGLRDETLLDGSNADSVGYKVSREKKWAVAMLNSFIGGRLDCSRFSTDPHYPKGVE